MSSLLSLVVSLSLLSFAVGQVATPGFLLYNPTPSISSRSYAACAQDVTAVGQNSTSVGMWVVGGYINGYFYDTYDYSTTGSFSATTALIQSTPTFTFNYTAGGQYVGSGPLGRLGPVFGVLGNGNLIYGTGKDANSYNRSNDFIYSVNKGATWSVATAAAPFQPRSDASLAVNPGTNTAVIAAGALGIASNSGGTPTNDIWISTDGIGAIWTFVGYTPGNAFDDGAIAFLYNSNNTLVLYNTNNNLFYTSLNYGVNWTFISVVNINGVSPGAASELTVDSANNIYIAGGVAEGGQIWFSSDKGGHWTIATQITNDPNVAVVISLTSFSYGCLGIIYSTAPAGSVNAVQTNLVFYGGNAISAVYDTNPTSGSGLSACASGTGTANFQSITAEVVFAGQTLPAITTTQTPSSINGGQPVVDFHDASSPSNLTLALYPSCGYDVHALLTRSTTPRMWQLGGFTSSYSYINTIEYTATGNWSQASMFTPTYLTFGPTGAPSGRVTAAAGPLYNGNFLYFGGKDNYFGNGANDVYMSTNNGLTFNLVVANASWPARSDFGFAFFPGTNTVMLAGGSNSGGGANLVDIWISTDGMGAVWTQVTSLPGVGAFADPAMVALYDANPPSVPYSTVIIIPVSSSSVWASTNLGTSWTAVGTQPWYPGRQNNELTADADNYLYATGGFADGRVYFSWNKGAAWTIIQQSNLGSPYTNTAEYASSTNNCQFIRYVAATATLASHPQLVLYGGGATINAINNATLSCTRTGVEVIYGDIIFPNTVASSTGPTSTANLCLIFYALPGNVDYPWSVATSLSLQYSATAVNNAYGQAVTITGGSGTRVFTNRFSTTVTSTLTVAAAGTGGSDNLLYLNSGFPFDPKGITFTLGAPTQLPGLGPLNVFSTITVANQTSAIQEVGESRVDPLGSAFLATVPGFVNVTIGASNINALAPSYSTCVAPITFTNGLRPPTQPTASNGGIHISYSYFISDGVTFSVQANLTLTASSAFGNQHDTLGNPYQTIIAVSGTRTYTYLLSPGSTVTSTVSTPTSTGTADQRFYPYALLASAPGVYFTTTAPYLDNAGVAFAITPSAPALGAPVGSGTQYSTTAVFFATTTTNVVLTELNAVTQPSVAYQSQTYSFM